MQGDSKHLSIVRFPGSWIAPSFKRFFKPSIRLISSPPLKRTGTHTTVKPSQGYLHRPQYPELAVLYPDPSTGKDVPPPPTDCTLQTLHSGGIIFFRQVQTKLAGQEMSQDILSGPRAWKGKKNPLSYPKANTG